jgi:hypothetical protein
VLGDLAANGRVARIGRGVCVLAIGIAAFSAVAIRAAAQAGSIGTPGKVAPPTLRFVEGGGKAFDTVPPSGFGFYEMVNNLVQGEPLDALGDVERRGPMAATGIVKGKPFRPEASSGGATGPLDSNDFRKVLERDSSPLQPAGTVLCKGMAGEIERAE